MIRERLCCKLEHMASLLRVLRFLRSSAAFLSASLVLLAAGSGVMLAMPKLVERAVDAGMTAGHLRALLLAAGGILAASLLAGGLSLASGLLLVRAGQRMSHELRGALVRHILGLSMADLDRFRTGQLMVRLGWDVNAVRQFIRTGLLMIVQALLLLAGSLTFMFRTDPRLAWRMAIVLPGVLALSLAFSVWFRPFFRKIRGCLDGVNNVLQETLAGAKVVRAFAREAYEAARFQRRNRAHVDISIRAGTIHALAQPFLWYLGQILALLSIWWLGGLEVIRGSLGSVAPGLSLGQLLAFNQYAFMSLGPVMTLSMVMNMTADAQVAAERIQEVLAVRPAVRESAGAVAVERFAGRILFQGVSFGYALAERDGGGRHAVEKVDLEIRPGERIGILGRSGSGKSSLVHLIPRFYDPVEGTVFIDGRDVRGLRLASLRGRIAVVLQQTVLLSGTIRENLLFGRPGASGGQLQRAAEIARAGEFIAEKERGWEEAVGERGTGLSAGQRQRIAIARAVLADPDILILDDATSALDARTERAVVDGVCRAFAGRTVVIVSQKINPLVGMDRILLMEEGRLAAQGSHGQLLGSSVTYRRICETQGGELRV